MTDSSAPNGSPPGWARSPWAIREELARRIGADLCGPLDGDEETIWGYLRKDGEWSGPERVRDRYLLGMLAPAGTVIRDPERTDDPGTGDEDPTSGSHDGRVAQRALARSSIGLTTAVAADVDRLVARCRWGAYEKVTDPGTGARIWQRTQVDRTVALTLRDGSIGPVPVNELGVVLRGRVTRAEHGSLRLVSVFLCNEQEPVSQNKDSRWLFQADFQLTAPDGGAVFCGRADATNALSRVPAAEREETARLDMAFRNQVELAVGHGVGVEWDLDSALRRGTRVGTAVIPRCEIGRTEAPDSNQSPHLAELITDMKSLAQMEPDALIAALAPLAAGYREWLDSEVERSDDLTGHESAAEAAVSEARRTADAIEAGVKLLRDNPDALEAFRFANQAMYRQRVHTVAVAARRDGGGLSLRQAVKAADIPANRSWRPFQLAFILLCLPSLTNPAYPDRGRDTALADLLFFPTGGGKTEAYLGLVAYTLAIRRLQGVVGTGEDAVDGRDGVAVLMRYTLRLLTAQQFQRAATLICAVELLRQQRARTDARYEGTPLRLGMWVGGTVTPNRDQDAAEWVESQRTPSRYFRGSGNPLQLSECPWCGHELDAGQDCRYDDGTHRFLVFCSDAECPFTARRSDGEGLPVITVDSQIYRLLPAFVIATVDKFAQLPWNGALSNLFGRVEQRCERHGYRNPDLDRRHGSHWREADSHRRLGDLPPAATVAVRRLRPPDLILQDEMHLVTGPLGTMAGLYETSIDRLATWSLDGRTVRPKVVASTATVRRADQQAWSLFWRRLRVFPPPVLDARRSFFAEQAEPTEAAPGRLYLGVCAHGERLKQVELRVFASLMAAAQAMYEELGKDGLQLDPWMTTVGYFNAVRELAGMRRMAEDELRSKLRRAETTTGLASRRSVTLEELTSRVSSDDIKAILRRLFDTHDPTRGDGTRPLDLLLATNMISVGVDVPRLGAMVVVGQPKATAEYIQATSRVGRTDRGPGLVVTIYNWARPRDMSHYETFVHYHRTFYRRVEPLSVTPFSERALDKGLTGTLVGAIRQRDADWNPNDSARRLDRQDSRILDHLSALAERAEAVTGAADAGQLARSMAERRLNDWDNERHLRPSLSYDRSPDGVPLLDRPEAGPWTEWTCPHSLRDTEAQTNLQIAVFDPSYESRSQPRIRLGLPEPGSDEARRGTAEDEDIEDDEAVDAAVRDEPGLAVT